MADDVKKEKLLEETNSRRGYKPRPICGTNPHSCNKLFLFIYATIYMFVGAGMFTLGIFVELERRAHSHLNNMLSLPLALVLFIGLFVALNALGGVYGTLREKPMLLKLFLCFTIVSFLVQISIGVLAYVYKQQIATAVKPNLMFAVETYEDSTEFTIAMDTLQSTFGCCGIDSYMDYEINEFYSCSHKDPDGYRSPDTCSVPQSCCTSYGKKEYGFDCGRNIRSNTTSPTGIINTQGCINAFTSWLHTRMDQVGAVALGFAIPQVVGFLLIYYFIQRVHDQRCWYTVANSNVYQTL